MSENKPEKTQIEGRVAQIINARELAINIGSKDGVRPKMKFAVLAESPIEVRDPGTQEVLDYIDREKVRVEASEVRDRITICRTYRVRHIPGGSLSGATVFGSMIDAMRPAVKITETLEAKDSSLPPPLSPEESYVKINDRVVQISDGDE